MMVRRTLLQCSPFIACGLVSAFTQWRIGTVVAFALSLVLTAVAIRESGRLAGAVLEISAAVFCGVAIFVAFRTPGAPIRQFIGALSNAWLALTAWLTVAAGRPFTGAVVRSRADRRRRREAAWRRTHVVLSSVWAAGFSVTTLVLVVVEAEAPHSGMVEVAVQVAGNLLPAVVAHQIHVGRTHRAEAPLEDGPLRA